MLIRETLLLFYSNVVLNAESNKYNMNAIRLQITKWVKFVPTDFSLKTIFILVYLPYLEILLWDPFNSGYLFIIFLYCSFEWGTLQA